MKRIGIALLLCLLLPLSTFALGFYVGGDAFYSSLVRPADVEAMDTEGLNLADFTFGGEARLIAGPFWGSAMGLYSPGDGNLPHHVDVLLDAGLGIALGPVHAGIGIGPNFGLEFGNNAAEFFRTGANARVTADIILGPVLVGVNWISEVQFTRASIADAFVNPYGKLGLSLLFAL